MDVSAIALFGLAEKRLGWLERREQVLAQNIANADTPGWRARDLTPFAATLSRQGGPPGDAAALARTEAGHLVGTAARTQGLDPSVRPDARAPDGNGVSIEQQLMKVADDQNAHELVTNLYQKYLGLFRLALGRGT